MGSPRLRVLIALGLAAATASAHGAIESVHAVAHAALASGAAPSDPGHEHGHAVAPASDAGPALDRAQADHDHDSVDQAAVSRSGPTPGTATVGQFVVGVEPTVRHEDLPPDLEFRPPSPPHQQPPTRAPPP